VPRSLGRFSVTRGDWIFYSALFVTATVSLLFDASDYIVPDQLRVSPWLPEGFLVLFGIGLITTGYVHYYQIASKQTEIVGLRDERARLTIQQFLELAVRSIEKTRNKPEIYRANIMLIKNNKLAIHFHYRMENASDRSVELEKNQGCAGQAWGSGEQKCADLRRAQQDAGGPSWNLTSEQIAMTDHLGAILSSPIVDPNTRDRILGVFNIDSALSLKETDFLDIEVSQLVMGYASLFGMLIADVIIA